MNSLCLSRARSGDRRAMESLIVELRPRVARMAAYYARCTQEDADDLLQEAWMGLLEALPDVNTQIGDPEQYLLQYARWRLLDAARRARNRRQPAAGYEQLEHLPGSEQANALSDVETTAFLLQLKETQRAVVTCLLAGMTWREAGALLGCTSANIAYHVRQIRQQYATWSGRPIASSG